MKAFPTRAPSLALIVFAAMSLSAPALWASHDASGSSRQEVAQNGNIGPDEAAAIVRARTGGRVLGVRAMRRGDRVVYRVKVLDKGYVRIYRVDGRSGSVSE